METTWTMMDLNASLIKFNFFIVSTIEFRRECLVFNNSIEIHHHGYYPHEYDGIRRWHTVTFENCFIVCHSVVRSQMTPFKNYNISNFRTRLLSIVILARRQNNSFLLFVCIRGSGQSIRYIGTSMLYDPLQLSANIK